jgi:hypothetical protein
MFRGTLKLNTLIAALQLVDAVCRAAILLSDGEISALGWTDFVDGLNAEKYPELILYLKQRRLYVNEPVSDYEEA